MVLITIALSCLETPTPRVSYIIMLIAVVFIQALPAFSAILTWIIQEFS